MKKMMSGFIAILSFVLFSCNSNDQKDPKDIADEKNDKKMENTKMADDAGFVTDVADGGMLEIKLGELAQTKASLVIVKDLAKMLISDHTKANNELAEAARKSNISMATGLSADRQKKYDDLAAKTGIDFDKEYTDLLKSAHEKTIKKLEEEIAGGHNADIKAWATTTLPVIKHHAEMVAQVYDKVRK